MIGLGFLKTQERSMGKVWEVQIQLRLLRPPQAKLTMSWEDQQDYGYEHLFQILKPVWAAGLTFKRWTRIRNLLYPTAQLVVFLPNNFNFFPKFCFVCQFDSHN